MADHCSSHTMIADKVGRLERSSEQQWAAIKEVIETCAAVQQSAALINQRLELHIKEESHSGRRDAFVETLKAVFVRIVEYGILAGLGWLLLHWAGKA